MWTGASPNAYSGIVSPESRRPCLARPQRRACRPAAEAPSASRTLLWIDDYEPGLALYKYMFESLGFRVLTASRGSAGLKLLNSNPVDAVVVDYEMPEMNGEAVASHIKHSLPQMPVVMFSGSSSVPGRVRNLVDAYCDKAESRETLVSTIKGVLANRTSHRSATPVYAA